MLSCVPVKTADLVALQALDDHPLINYVVVFRPERDAFAVRLKNKRPVGIELHFRSVTAANLHDEIPRSESLSGFIDGVLAMVNLTDETHGQSS
jgi:hypothetical protein